MGQFVGKFLVQGGRGLVHFFPELVDQFVGFEALQVDPAVSCPAAVGTDQISHDAEAALTVIEGAGRRHVLVGDRIGHGFDSVLSGDDLFDLLSEPVQIGAHEGLLDLFGILFVAVASAADHRGGAGLSGAVQPVAVDLVVVSVFLLSVHGPGGDQGKQGLVLQVPFVVDGAAVGLARIVCSGFGEGLRIHQIVLQIVIDGVAHPGRFVPRNIDLGDPVAVGEFVSVLPEGQVFEIGVHHQMLEVYGLGFILTGILGGRSLIQYMYDYGQNGGRRDADAYDAKCPDGFSACHAALLYTPIFPVKFKDNTGCITS